MYMYINTTIMTTDGKLKVAVTVHLSKKSQFCYF